MGNTSTKPTPREASFGQILDFIATKYILTSNFKSLTQLYEKDYCDNLTVLTSDIIEKYFNDLEITYLSQRVKNGVEENIMDKDRMMFFTKDELDELNIKVPLKKKRVCRGIAKFYIKIAHVFSAIVTTINPVYVYKDDEGNVVKKKLSEKDTIPKNVEKKLYKLGLCDTRLNALKRSQKDELTQLLTLNPRICSIHKGKETLEDEAGIPELESLYYDQFDFQTGQFTGMTEETKIVYQQDLAKFYETFTGSPMPDTVKRFSDIRLRDYETTEGCAGRNAPLRQAVTDDPKNRELHDLFATYGKNVRQMMDSAKQTQDALLEIINQLFTYVIDKTTGQKTIRVNPKLTETGLSQIVIRTRNIIMNMYLRCETDFTTGVKLYQAILEKKVKDTAFKQVDVLEKTKYELINGAVTDASGTPLVQTNEWEDAEQVVESDDLNVDAMKPTVVAPAAAPAPPAPPVLPAPAFPAPALPAPALPAPALPAPALPAPALPVAPMAEAIPQPPPPPPVAEIVPPPPPLAVEAVPIPVTRQQPSRVFSAPIRMRV